MDYKVVYEVELKPGRVASSRLNGCRVFTGLRKVESGNYRELDEEIVDLISDIVRDSFTKLGVGCEFDIYISDIAPLFCGVCGGYGFYLGALQSDADSTLVLQRLSLRVCSCTSVRSLLDDVLHDAITRKITLREYPAAEEED